ncbi:glutathione S-transferase D6-like isoform X2 [Drosophila kikkawai]|uniref:Glutathione S-transferase D6-like isoform X2 n=1 Tax=Drosophila kikkawai TaxID=30033 RepID=A0A6P4ISX9_DROKI|nr:glutathione S-transferase D6-like isoform X2 [Drosophila kikkawai]
MSTLDFYNMAGAPGSLAVIMTAKAVGVELNSINRTVPTLVDNGFVVWETRAIVVYLVEKYGKPDSSLYPKDPQIRAVINQRMYFDMGTLYDAFDKYYFYILRNGKEETEENLEKLNAAFKLLNTFLEGQDYVAGSQMSVADFVIFATVLVIRVVDFDLKEFPNVDRWFTNVQNVPLAWAQDLRVLCDVKKFLCSNLKK